MNAFCEDGLIGRYYGQNRGFALVICLSMVALLSVVVLALFSQSRTNIQTESNGAARSRASILAHTGLDYVVASLIGEITDPARSTRQGDVFVPISATTMVPTVALKSNAIGLRNIHVPSLLKQSFTGFDLLVSTIPANTPDKRGTFIAPDRWNAPTLYYSTPQFTTAAQTPDWLYLSDQGPANTSPVLGRIAFNVYQLNRLLDLSVSGYPTSLNADPRAVDSLKGSTAGADVTRISLFAQYLNQTLIDKRSQGLDRSGDFVTRRLAEKEGFLTAAAGETHFASRLDLIRYALVDQFNNNSLAFVSAWSRSVDAPSHQPATPTAANVFAPSVKRSAEIHVTDFFPDGETRSMRWQQGDPVAARRFALSHLAWFDAADSTTRSTAIRQYFGLQAGINQTWLYPGDHILTLSELATEGREPNFFEMLKAAIATNSLGRAGAGPYASQAVIRDSHADLQVLRIGASIIDAARAGCEPSIISMVVNGASRYVAGVEDLPYLSGVRFRQIIHTSSEGVPIQADLLALPVLLNPHPPKSVDRPPVRLRIEGTIANPVASLNDADFPLSARLPASAEPAPDERVIPFDANGYSTLSPIVPFTPSPGFGAQPAMPSYYTGVWKAFWLASGPVSGPANHPKGRATLENFNLILEYWNGALWVPYDALVGDGRADPITGLGAAVNLSFSSTGGTLETAGDADFTGADTVYLLKADPRSTRGGPLEGSTDLSPTSIPAAVASLKTGDLTIAKITIDTASTTLQARRSLPQRLFHTVGELGAVFRDNAWSTLDFANVNSPDAVLLDYFSISPSAGVVTGKLCLNGAMADVMEAQIARTINEEASGTRIDASLLPQITSLLAAAPFKSPADLVGRVILDADDTKEKRETVVRALGTAGQTRTWNFFIDLIAQAGQLSPKSSTDLNHFIAHAEYRLWMHVAIDRFTGRVIDSHLEAYQE